MRWIKISCKYLKLCKTCQIQSTVSQILYMIKSRFSPLKIKTIWLYELLPIINKSVYSKKTFNLDPRIFKIEIFLDGLFFYLMLKWKVYFLLLLCKKAKYHFLSLWYDSIWNWTQVSRVIGEHSNHHANVQSRLIKRTKLFESWLVVRYRSPSRMPKWLWFKFFFMEQNVLDNVMVI